MRGWARAKSLLNRFTGNRRRRMIALGLGFAVIATLAAIFISRQVALVGFRRDIARIETEQAQAATRQKELRAEVASTSDPKTLEDEARRRLGLVKPGEEKVFFVEEGSP